MFYCGIGLSARDSHICVLDQDLSIHLRQKVPNELSRFSKLQARRWCCTVRVSHQAGSLKQARQPLSQERFQSSSYSSRQELSSNTPLL